MGKDPAVLFYASDFLTGTSYFSMEQRGKYITLLCEQHQNGPIPANHFSSICNSDQMIIKKFKIDENGCYYNQRMKDETERRSSFCKSRRDSADKRWCKNDKPLSGKRIGDMRTHMHTDMRMETETDTEDRDDTEKRKCFKIPSFEEVKNYCIKRKNSIDPQNFIDHYEARGWQFKTGQKMKSWPAAIRTWEKNNFNNNKNQTDSKYLGHYERLN